MSLGLTLADTFKRGDKLSLALVLEFSGIDYYLFL